MVYKPLKQDMEEFGKFCRGEKSYQAKNDKKREV